MARRYEYYFRVVKTIFYERAQPVDKMLFYHEKIIFISCIFKLPCNVFFVIWSEVRISQQKLKKCQIKSGDPAGKHTRVTYFFISFQKDIKLHSRYLKNPKNTGVGDISNQCL